MVPLFRTTFEVTELCFGHNQPDHLFANRLAFKCKLCTRTFSSRLGLQNHSRIHNSSIQVLPVKIHEQVEELSTSFQCRICSTEFDSNHSLTVHLQTMCAKGLNQENSPLPFCKKIIKCLECLKSFGSPAALMRHRRSHLGTKLFKCNKCGISFLQQCYLLEHLPAHRIRSEHQCSTCTASYKTKEELEEHLNMHANRNSMYTTCVHCKFAFASKSLLQIHVTARHTRKQPFECSICHSQFSARSQVQQHVRLHRRLNSNTENIDPFALAQDNLQASSSNVNNSNTENIDPFALAQDNLQASSSNVNNSNTENIDPFALAQDNLQASSSNVNNSYTENIDPFALAQDNLQASSSNVNNSNTENIDPFALAQDNLQASSSNVNNSNTENIDPFALAQDNLQASSSNVNNSLKFVCKICNNLFSFFQCLKQHMQHNHYKFYCDICHIFFDETYLSSESKISQKAVCMSCEPGSQGMILNEADGCKLVTPACPQQYSITKLVWEFLHHLVDDELLKSKGVLDQPVGRQLEVILDLCDPVSGKSTSGSAEECLLKNLKSLFMLCVDEASINFLLQCNPIEEVVHSMLQSLQEENPRK